MNPPGKMISGGIFSKWLEILLFPNFIDFSGALLKPLLVFGDVNRSVKIYVKSLNEFLYRVFFC
jgi:hypothetical protein